MDATSQIGRKGRDAIIDNIQSALTEIDIGLNRQRARANAGANFVYKTDEEIDNMYTEDIKEYARACRNGWQELIVNEEEGVGLVCVNS